MKQLILFIILLSTVACAQSFEWVDTDSLSKIKLYRVNGDTLADGIIYRNDNDVKYGRAVHIADLCDWLIEEFSVDTTRINQIDRDVENVERGILKLQRDKARFEVEKAWRLEYKQRLIRAYIGIRPVKDCLE